MRFSLTLPYCAVALMLMSSVNMPPVSAAGDESDNTVIGNYRSDMLQEARRTYETLKKQYNAERYWRKRRGETVPTEAERELLEQLNRALERYRSLKTGLRVKTPEAGDDTAVPSMPSEGLRRARIRFGTLKRAYEKEKYLREMRGRKAPTQKELELLKELESAQRRLTTIENLYKHRQ